MMMLMCSAALSGCLGSDADEEISAELCSGDELIIAYEIKEDMPADDIQNPQQIANYL